MERSPIHLQIQHSVQANCIGHQSYCQIAFAGVPMNLAMAADKDAAEPLFLLENDDETYSLDFVILSNRFVPTALSGCNMILHEIITALTPQPEP